MIEKRFGFRVQSFSRSFSWSFAFVFSSAIAWFLVNDGIVTREEGFDPFLFEYFARNGLPDNLVSVRGYWIVILLISIYTVFPYYWGFTFFNSLLCAGLSRKVKCDEHFFSVFNPITLYYLGQTGKDGITCLAYLSIFFIFTSKFNLSSIAPLLILFLGLAIRQPIAFFVLPIYFFVRHGFKSALLVSLAEALIFYNIDDGSTANALAHLVDTDNSGDIVSGGRYFTYGPNLVAVSIRFMLYSTSLIFQPAVGFLKYIESDEYFLLYESIVNFIFLIFVYRYIGFKEFIIVSVPFCALLAIVFPFYHFRYLATLFPLFVAMATVKKVGWNFK